MKTIHLYIGVLALLLSVTLTAQAASEARFGKLSKTYTLHADGSQELRVQKELTLYTHAAMNSLYGETFIVYDPQYQQLEIHDSYTRQKDGTRTRGRRMVPSSVPPTTPLSKCCPPQPPMLRPTIG